MPVNHSKRIRRELEKAVPDGLIRISPPVAQIARELLRLQERLGGVITVHVGKSYGFSGLAAETDPENAPTLVTWLERNDNHAGTVKKALFAWYYSAGQFVVYDDTSTRIRVLDADDAISTRLATKRMLKFMSEAGGLRSVPHQASAAADEAVVYVDNGTLREHGRVRHAVDDISRIRQDIVANMHALGAVDVKTTLRKPAGTVFEYMGDRYRVLVLNRRTDGYIHSTAIALFCANPVYPTMVWADIAGEHKGVSCSSKAEIDNRIRKAMNTPRVMSFINAATAKGKGTENDQDN